MNAYRMQENNAMLDYGADFNFYAVKNENLKNFLNELLV